MAKRKRKSIETPSKKAKSTKTKDKNPFDDLAEGFWPIKAIRGERRDKKGGIQYLVEWAEDPETGEQYPLEWNPDVTDAAIAEWNSAKKEKYEIGDLDKGEEVIVPEHRPASRLQRVKPRRVVLSSPSATTQSTAQTTESTESGSVPQNTIPLITAGSKVPELEVPETQVQEQQNSQANQVTVSPVSRSQEEAVRSDIRQQQTHLQAPGEEDNINSGLPAEHPPSVLPVSTGEEQFSTEDTGNTIPDSQAEELHSFQPSSPSLHPDPTTQLQLRLFRRPAAQASRESLAPNAHSIDHNRHQQRPYFTSPEISSPETQLFDEARSAQDHSACSSVESDSEILSHSQGISNDQSQSQSRIQSQPNSISNSTPSAQPGLVPSIEEDFAAGPFQTQARQSFASTRSGSDREQTTSQPSNTLLAVNPSIYPESPRRQVTPKSNRVAGKDLRNQNLSTPRRETSSQESDSIDPGSLRAYRHLHQQPWLRSNSMARTSRESTPRSSRASPAVSSVTGQSLQEKLANMRAPAKALAEARRKTNTATNAESLPVESDLETSAGNPTPIVDEASDSNVLQSTEQSGPSDMSMYSQEEPPISGTLAPAPIIIESGSADVASTELDSQDALMTPQLGPSEYVVALPVEGKMRDQYLETIHLKDSDINKYLQASRKSSGPLVNSMKSMIELLALMTAHTDYIIQGQLTQAHVSPTQEATWADYASTKFAFLNQLFDIIRSQSKTILLVASSRQVRDGLAMYCTGKGVQHTMLDEQSGPTWFGNDPDSQLNVLVSETYNGTTQQAIPKTDLIIVFDTSAVITNSVRESRSGTGPPVIHLVVKNSPEHAALCLPRSTAISEVLYRLVRETTASRRALGRIQIGTEPQIAQYPDYNQRTQAMKRDFQTKIMMAAKAVAHCLSEEDFDASWPLPVVPFDTMTNFQYPPAPPSVRSLSPVVSRTGTPLGQKRNLDALDGSGTKRQRLTPLHDVTHVTDSMEGTQSQVDRLKEELRKAQQALAQEQSERAAEIEAQRITRAAAESRVGEMTMELRKIQYRYETRTREVHTMRRTIKKLEEQRVSDANQRARILGDNDTLKEQRKSLQSELNAARIALKEGGGTTGELELAREQIRQLEKEKASLEKSNANMKKDFDFTRIQYQTASTAAADSASQITDLETEMAGLKTAASDEKRRLKETNFSDDRARYLAHIAQLEGELASRDSILQRKEEELKTVKRGRGMQTRASSVQPGSPRLAGIGATPGSRGTSPVPGLLSVGRMSALRHER